LISLYINYLKRFRQTLSPKVYFFLFINIFIAFIDGFGIILIIPLLGSMFLGETSQVSLLGIEKLIPIDVLGFEQLIVLIIITFSLKSLLIFHIWKYTTLLKEDFSLSIRKKLSKNYLTQNFEDLISRQPGRYVDILSFQVDKMFGALHSLLRTGTQILNALVYLIFVFYISYSVGLISAALGFLFWYFFKSLSIKTLNLSRLATKNQEVFSNIVGQVFSSIKYIKSSAIEKRSLLLIEQSAKKIKKYNYSKSYLAGITHSLREPLIIVFILLNLFIQYSLFNQTVSAIITSMIILYRVISSFHSAQQGWQGVLDSIGSFEKIESEINSHDLHNEKEGMESLQQVERGIHFKNVTFAYKNDIRPIVRDFNLFIKKNQTIALIGKSGSGKTTLVDLITLLIEPTSGAIEIDNITSENLNKFNWRKKIGYLLQDGQIFNGSLVENIVFSDPSADSGIDLRRLRSAIKFSGVNQFISSIKDGLKANLGENGIQISGGQKQRLLLARELYKSPEILILDEATSALDKESEEIITSSLEKLNGTITIIIITHRETLLRCADKIYKINKGSISWSGNYKEYLQL